MSLNDCIQSLKNASEKQGKFEHLRKKVNDRFSFQFTIDVGTIENMTAGFDNHRNHQRPHIHIDTKIKNIGKISIAIDDGNLLHSNKGIDKKTLRKISTWVLERKDCLKLIYDNIQNCRSKSDFEPLINAIDKFF